ncbi:MAG TPA: hypothetical protein VHW60_24805 [Caulobacteraceae bacterium]|jgi:hypothetical protein|nr:hypothetical protein [Caulobacteraceae bacterium]
MAIGDMFVLGLGAAIILGAVTPFFRKLTPTQAAAVAFGVLLIAAPMLKDYSLSLLGVSAPRTRRRR